MTLFYKTGSGFPFDLGSIVFKKVDGKRVYGKVHRVDFCKDGVRYRFKPFKKQQS